MWNVSLHYLWWILALLLIAGELLVPGYFMLWIGMAAAAMGVLVWLVPGLGLLAQAVLFALLALLACVCSMRVCFRRGSNAAARAASGSIGAPSR